jgi:hypothetical protein
LKLDRPVASFVDYNTVKMRFRVRWWSDGTSYSGVKDQSGWHFYENEKEADTVRWYETSSTPDLVSKAERLLSTRENVQELGPDQDESFEADPPAKRDPQSSRIFICYAKEDQFEAEKLFRRLRRAGFEPWMDKQCLVLGDSWEQEIRTAVAKCDAFVPCLRPGFDEIGFRQQEIRWPLDAFRIRPPSGAFIFPFIVEP